MISVRVAINYHGIGTLDITRTEDLKYSNRQLYEYQAVLSEDNTEVGSIFFQHDRGDSVWILIQKALLALGEAQLLPLEWEKD